MPKDKMNENKFKNLFYEASRYTKNFQKIDHVIIAKRPNLLKVFRMIHGLGLIDFAKLLKKNYNTISQYELGGIKSIRESEAKRIVAILTEEMPTNLSKEQTIQNFYKFKELSSGGAVQGFKRAEKAALTNGEKKIEKLLNEYGIKFEPHKTLDTNIGPLNFDFLVGNKLLIECTDSKSKQKAESLGFRALKIKQAYPHLTTVVIIPYGITNGVKRRLNDFDHIIFSNKLDGLETLLK